MKSCSQCKIEQPLDNFHKYNKNLDGRHSICKKCRSAYNKSLRYKRPINGRLRCNSCHIIKDVQEFYADCSSSNGLQSYCKSCLKEKIYESQSKLDNYMTKLYNQFQTQYKEKICFTLEDLIYLYEKQNRKCAYTDELLTYYSGPVLTKDSYESKFNITIDYDKSGDNESNINLDDIKLIGKIIKQMKKNIDSKEFMRLCKLISNSDSATIYSK